MTCFFLSVNNTVFKFVISLYSAQTQRIIIIIAVIIYFPRKSTCIETYFWFLNVVVFNSSVHLTFLLLYVVTTRPVLQTNDLQTFGTYQTYQSGLFFLNFRVCRIHDAFSQIDLHLLCSKCICQSRHWSTHFWICMSSKKV